MDFGSAMQDWKKRKEKYIKDKQSKGSKLSPRQSATYSIPSLYKEEINKFIQEMRYKADREYNGFVEMQFGSTSEQERKILSLEFEKANPPPAVKDY